jgi:hypothetical protein
VRPRARLTLPLAPPGPPRLAAGGSKPPLAGVEVEEQPQRSTLARLAGVAGSVTSAAVGAASKAATLGPSLLGQGAARAAAARGAAPRRPPRPPRAPRGRAHPPARPRPPPSRAGVRSLTNWVAGPAVDPAGRSSVPAYDLASAPKPEPSLPWRALRDDARTLGPLVPAPLGALLATADNLGRVLLVSGADMTVLRMWKVRACSLSRGAGPSWPPRAAACPLGVRGLPTLGFKARPPAGLAWASPPRGPAHPPSPTPSTQPHPTPPPKGYRDAQCGWAVASEPHPWARHGLLLVLYAPRRELLEVWCPRSGARVAARRVEGAARLLPVPTPCGGWQNELLPRWQAASAPSTVVLRLGPGRERGALWDVLDLAGGGR